MSPSTTIAVLPHTPVRHKPQPATPKEKDSLSYEARLFDHSWDSRAYSTGLPLLKYDTLLRMNIVHIQNELAKLKGTIITPDKTKPEELGRLRGLLHDYGKITNSSNFGKVEASS